MSARREHLQAQRSGCDEERLLGLLDRLAREMQPRRRGRAVSLSLETRLDRDLGLDSLARAELILRLQREFRVDLPDRVMEADTAQALLAELAAARASDGTGDAQIVYAPPQRLAGHPQRARTLHEALHWHLERHPDRVHAHIYADGPDPEPCTYRQLHLAAGAVASGLLALGVRPGATVALMLPTGREYFDAFLGILYAGAVPVPIYPPARPSQLEEHLRRHGRILTNARAKALITVPEARRVSRLLRAEAPELRHIVTVEDLAAKTFPAERPPAIGSSLALVQYTSGSTGDPKGVALTHQHLLANIRAMGERAHAGSTDVFVSWLPLYHDMGLIGAWIGSLYYGMPFVVMSPLRFLAQPIRWLRTIHRHGGTISGAPNFGYELCLRSITPDQLEGLDLSSWRLSFNGAEPVSAATIERFVHRFAPCGLRADAITPVYGLAEASLGLTIPEPGHGVRVDRVDRQAFMHERQAFPVASRDRDELLEFVSCGTALEGFTVRIVGAGGRELPERHEGDIQFRGPSATTGYLHRPELSRSLFDGDWVQTGDRGYLADGELYVTGRSKDLIIRAGRNIYPYELEQGIGDLDGVRKGCVAVLGCAHPETGSEQLVVVAETRENDAAARATLEQQIRDVSVQLVDVAPDDVRLVPPHGVLKTSSGKIRRAATCELYRSGKLGQRRSALWVQVTRLGVRSLGGWVAHLGTRALRTAYAGYAWTLAVCSLVLIVAAAFTLPRQQWRWTTVRRILHGMLVLAGIRVRREGLEHLPRDSAFVLAANHTSYLDVPLLMATLPQPVRFLAKREFVQQRFVAALMRRLCVLFVERFDKQRAAEDAKQAEEVLARGDNLAYFPEGTFYAHPGLNEFKMGAFLSAAHTGKPIVPVALCGVRELMRGSEKSIRPGRARIVVGKPIHPEGSDWEAAVRLRESARAFVLAESKEPDLEELKNS